MKRRILAAGICCAATVFLAPSTANAVPTGSFDSGASEAGTGSAGVLPLLLGAAVNCLITGIPMQACGYTGAVPAP